MPAITSDGRVFRRIEEAPEGFARAAMAPQPPPVGALEVAQLSEAGLMDVVRKAAELRLLEEPPDYGDPMITDQGSLVVTLSTAGATYEHDVYAPGEEVDDDDAQAARDRLDEFVDFVSSLQTHLDGEIGPWTPYVPEQWVVDVHPQVESWDAEPWPFDVAPSEGCTSFELAGGTDTVSGVYTATVDGSDEIVEVRPALPFTAC